MDKKIRTLAEQYRNKRHRETPIRESIYKLYEKYIREREQTLMDSISASAAVGALFLSDQIDFSKVTPQMEEAFKLAYPNIELSSLADRSPEEVQGFISAWKGKYFEVLVRDNLNAGEWVGDIHLQAGQYAELAESATQPGWDLQIFDENGEVINELQLKATQSLGYIKTALERYPDIDVLTTEEVFDSATDISDQILNSGMSEEELRETIQAPMEALFDSPLVELAEDILPFLPFVIIAVGEGRKVIMGKKSFEMALSDSLFRATKTGAAIGVGGIVALLDGGLLSIPAVMLTRIGFDRLKIMKTVINHLNQKIISSREILPIYTKNQLLLE